MEDLSIKRKTAAKYLDMLVEKGFMSKQKIGRTNFFINEQLYLLLRGKSTADKKVDRIKTINLTN